MNFNRRQAIALGLGSLAAGVGASASAQADFPTGVIKFVIPTPAGGGHDTMMRLIGQKLTERLGQSVIVESKPGASGSIAAASVAQAAPDGHTLLLGYSAFLSNQLLMPKPGYRVEDFVPVSMLALTPIAMGVRESLPAKTLKEFIALAKSQPGKLSYGSYGPGSGGHFVGELFNSAAGLNVLHIPYKGEAPALQALLGEQIDAAFTSVGGVHRYPGRIRPIAVATAQRSPSYPNVPTFAELGLPAVDMPGWGALFAPAKTPKPVVDKLTAEINRIVLLPDVKAKLAELGFDSVGWDPARVNSFMAEQMAATKKIVDTGRVKL